MSGVGRWNLGIGLALVVVAVVCVVLDAVAVGTVVGILGLAALCVAGYDAAYEMLTRRQLRRRQERARS